MKLSQIREVGALHFADGLTTREIEARTGISRSTAARIIALLEGAELPWEELAAADDSSLASALGLAPQAAGAAGDGYVQPDFEKVLRKQRQNRKLSVKACYEAFYANGNSGQAQGGLRLYSLSRFRELYREWLARRHGAASASAIPCGPGEIMEIDYSGDPLVWYSRGRKRHESQVFVAVMRSCSPWRPRIRPQVAGCAAWPPRSRASGRPLPPSRATTPGRWFPSPTSTLAG